VAPVGSGKRRRRAIGLGGAVLFGAAGTRYVGEGTGFFAAVDLAALAVLAGTLIGGTVRVPLSAQPIGSS
jgi:hypothetical protein